MSSSSLTPNGRVPMICGCAADMPNYGIRSDVLWAKQAVKPNYSCMEPVRRSTPVQDGKLGIIQRHHVEAYLEKLRREFQFDALGLEIIIPSPALEKSSKTENSSSKQSSFYATVDPILQTNCHETKKPIYFSPMKAKASGFELFVSIPLKTRSNGCTAILVALARKQRLIAIDKIRIIKSEANRIFHLLQ